MNRLEDAFKLAQQAYPQAIRDGVSRWQLVDAITASFRTPEREGMLVLKEERKGCHEPFHHWGFMVAKSGVQG